jgi:hypothetical protein
VSADAGQNLTQERFDIVAGQLIRAHPMRRWEVPRRCTARPHGILRLQTRNDGLDLMQPYDGFDFKIEEIYDALVLRLRTPVSASLLRGLGAGVQEVRRSEAGGKPI